MKLTNNLRIHTDKNHKDLYNDLKSYAFGDMHEIFFLAASIGFQKHERKPLGKMRDDRFWSDTITPEEYSSYYAMVLDDNDLQLESLKDDRKVLDIIEEYANAGIIILIDEFLNDYLIDGCRIDKGTSKELPKELLGYIMSRINE